MLWYKSFLETRSRFLIGLVILLMSVCGTVYAYPRVERLLPMMPAAASAGGGLVAERIRELESKLDQIAAELKRLKADGDDSKPDQPKR